MGGPLHVTFSDIYILKIENEVVALLNLNVYDIFNRRKKNVKDFFLKTQQLPTKHQAYG